MIKLTRAMAGVITAVLVSAHAHASDEVVHGSMHESPAFTSSDIHHIIERGTGHMGLASLSNAEMKETEGAWITYVVGGFAGGLYNGIGYYSSPNQTAGGWVTAVGSGVVGGAVGGIRWWSAPIWGGGIAAAGGWAATR